ncbi:MAG: cyclic nucleotide-binding domain-containing protein [Gammaproteobacteria bacterium]|nr:cyclic nucleotide-binding domain-containing protein [Gammaproteobacteria bacterium]
MFHNLTIPDECSSLWKQCQSLVPDLLQGCKPKSPGLIITADQPIDTKIRSFYVIKDGSITESHEGQVLINYEANDLVWADALFHPKSSVLENDFEVRVDEYDGDEFVDEILKDKNKFIIWNQYLSALSQSYQLLMGHFSKQDFAFKPEFRYYQEGEIIIEQDTVADEVFTLLSGKADVLVDNTVVGEINTDEIFGAIAALSSTRRIASVVATSDCETIVVKSDRFRGLLAARPDTVQKLINDMARTIASCNDKIMTLSNSGI